MGQHYLPVYYLKGFSNQNKIWGHDKYELRSFMSQPKSVANETDMYGKEVELFLTKEIEGPALEALAAVLSQKEITSSERTALAQYIVYLLRRTPKGRAFVADLLPKHSELLRHVYREELESLRQTQALDDQAVSERLRVVNRVLDRLSDTGNYEIWQQSLIIHNSTMVVNELLKLQWIFLVTKDVSFVTGDHPVFFFSEGIGNSKSELTVPLSSSICLIASSQLRGGQLYRLISPSIAREINRRTAWNSVRYIFDYENAGWIMNFIKKKDYIPRRRIWPSLNKIEISLL